MSRESAASPWECADHWASGDSALWIGVGSSGFTSARSSSFSPAGALVRDPEVTYNDGIFTLSDGLRDVRHRDSCEPCAASVRMLHQGGV